MRARSLAAIGIAAYAIFLVATIPASVVAARVAADSSGLVRVNEPTGTLWHGEASASLLAPGGSLVLDRIEWRFAPAALAGGHLAFDVTASGHGLDASARVGRGLSRWLMASVDAHMDARIAAVFTPLVAAAHPEGRIALATPELRLRDDGTARGKLEATWSDAAISLSDVKPLGKYRVQANAEDGPVSIDLTTISGPLRLSGHGTFTPPAQLSFSGEARGEGTDARALDTLLDMMGPRRADGAREIRIQR